MPTARSSSNLNARIFTPTLILTQDTRRLFITINSSGAGYTVDAGIAAGDVVRYDPQDQTYKKSVADTEENAEVIGVVESISGSNYTVVTAGSIAYPTSRLNSILDGGTGGKDILFLDTSIAGGLTGTIEIPTGSSTAIVKPVLQTAPHSIYNAIVINYIGYKIGNAAGAEKAIPVGNVVYATPNSDPGPYYKKADGFELSVTDYPEMYAVYGLTNGPHTIKLILDSSTGISSGLNGGNVTQYYNSSITNIGTVTAWNAGENSLTVTRTENSAALVNNSTVYCNGYSWKLVSNTPLTFTVPAVDTTIKQGNIELVPYIAIRRMVDITIPNTISVENIEATDSISVGAISDLEQTISQIQTDITTIKNILRIGGS